MRRKLFHAHRYIGVFCALFVIMLAVTGVMLNHTESLALDERHVQSTILLDLYGIEAPEIEHSYSVDRHWISQIGNALYFDQTSVAILDEPLTGGAKGELFYVAATSSMLLLVGDDGRLIEKLTALHGVPGSIQAIGMDDNTGRVVLRTADGVFIADAELFEWHTSVVDDVTWSDAQSLPADMAQRMATHYIGEGLTIERVILDLHSGRIAGRYGVLLMDVVAVLFLFLAIVGVWLWLVPRRAELFRR